MDFLNSPIGDNTARETRHLDATAIALVAITALAALVGGAFSVIYP